MAINSIRKEYGNYIAHLAKKDERIFALEGDLCESTQSVIFKKTVPERYFEMGVMEQNMVGIAAGLAISGKIPIVHSFACFISMRTCEQVRTSICYPNLNVKFFASHGGIFAGSAGTTHHSLEDLAIMRAIPNMTVLVPGDIYELRRAVDVALVHDGPVYIRVGKDDAEDVFDNDYKFTIGNATMVLDGKDGTIITTGTMLQLGIEAASILKKEHNLSIRILHCASLKPIDKESIIKAAVETRNIVTVEEHSIIGGLGGAVCEIVAELGMGRVKRIGINDQFCGVGSTSFIMEEVGLTSSRIISELLKLIKKSV